MTDQELYDRVKAHLLKQNSKSLNFQAQCVYRGKDGMSCAIGCLIPDYAYSPAFETVPIGAYRADIVRRAAGIAEEQRLLAGALQRVHDGSPVDMWARRLREVALDFGLTP